MQPSLIFSIIFHVILLIILYFGLPSFYDKKEIVEAAINIDLVPIKDVSNISNKQIKRKHDNKPDEVKNIVKATAEQKNKMDNQSAVIEQKPKEEIKINEKKTKIDDKPAIVEPKPKEEIKTKNSEQKPKEEHKLEVKKEKSPARETNPKKEEKKKVVENIKEKQQQKEEKKKKQDINFDTDGLLKSLEDKADKKTDKAHKNKTSQKKEEIGDVDSKSKDFKSDQELSLSEKDNIRKQIESQWQIVGGIKGLNGMKILVKFSMDREGNVLKAEHIGGNDGGNPFGYQLISSSAVGAAYRASPIQNLNPDHYHIWNEVIMTLVPQQN